MKLPIIETFALEGVVLEHVFEENFSKLKDKKQKNVCEYDSLNIEKVVNLVALRRYVERVFGLINNGFFFDKLWLVETLPENMKIGELPYVPHIDYRRFLKVMIYVDDVTETSGPFSAIHTNPDNFEDFRMGLKPNYKKNKLNQISDFLSDEYEKYTGPKGMMILFDTNCPHFAATVSPGCRRRVFRFDYEHPEWKRKESLLLKIGKLLLK
jgi:hypothetical protein